MPSNHTINRVTSEQFAIVDQLIERQDALLEQLDELDSRVEIAIKRFLPAKESGSEDVESDLSNPAEIRRVA